MRTRKRILLIDDDKQDFLLIQDLLCASPLPWFELDWAATYESGLETILRGVHDVHLVNQRLGTQNGLDLIREAVEAGARIPMILIAAERDYSVDVMAMEAGASDYVLKSQLNAYILERCIRYAVEARKAEEAIRRSEARYRAIVEDQTELISRTLSDGTITFVNEALSRFCNKPACEFTGRNFLEFVPREDRGEVERARASLTPQDPVAILEHRVRSPNGQVHWQEWSNRAIFDCSGRVIEIQGVGRDITALRHTSEELQKSRELFERTFNSQLDAIFILDDHSVPGIIDCNPAATLMFGYTREELIGESVEVLHKDAGTLLCFRTEIARSVEDHGYHHEESYVMKRKDGASFPTEHSVVPLIGDAGERFGWVSVVKDITDRKMAYQALQESAERMKRFAYAISHDLKSPAVAVHGLAKRLSRLYRKSLDEKGLDYCNKLLQGTEQIVAFTDRLNKYIATRELPFNPEQVSLEDLFQELDDEFGLRLTTRGIHWSVRPEPVWVVCDRINMVRALANLVENAFKYGGEKLTEIELRCIDSPECCTLLVKDDGVGMRLDECSKVFELFRRGTGSKGIPGTGLGLGIVREIAEQHGGEAGVRSAPGKGAIFYITLPRNR